MSEQRLRELLAADATVSEREAEERGWAIVKAAYADRTAAAPPRSHRALVLALAGAALLLALLFSPAGAQVREWIGDVVEGEDDAAPSLTSLPASGELLVESELGPWIVQEDGSKRLVGSYDSATFSPHGRYLAVTEGGKLFAVVADSDAAGQPVGMPRWEISAPTRVHDVTWAPSGVRVAYSAGKQLRVVRGDGEQDHVIASSVGPVAPAWRPLSERAAHCLSPDGSYPCARNVLAYVDASRQLHVIDVATGKALFRHSVEPFPGEVTSLAWSPDGRRLLVLAGDFAVVLRADGTFASKLLTGGDEAAFSPTGDAIAVLSHEWRPGGTRSELSLIRDEADGGKAVHLYGGPGRITDLTWSPDGEWLLVAYPGADQWVFVPVGDHGHLEPVAGIADEFDAGSARQGPFPHVSGWCCVP